MPTPSVIVECGRASATNAPTNDPQARSLSQHFPFAIASADRLLTQFAVNVSPSTTAPILNVLPFGACSSLSNPTVAAATTAALGVLTPMPCIPVPAGTWIPGSTKAILKGMPALDSAAKLMCSWGGVIQILNPGQTKVIDG